MSMTEERKIAVLFAATILSARKLAECDDRPSPRKITAVQKAIRDAKFILDEIDHAWSTRTG